MTMTSRWIYRLADNMFLRGGFYEPSFDKATEGIATFAEGDEPDPLVHRYDPSNSANPKRAATQAELDAMTQVVRDTDITADKKLQALARATWEIADASPKPTLQQFVDRIKQIYRSL